jgi:tetratricopeptide (TPR) repeat protein
LSTARLYDRQNDRDKALTFYRKALDVDSSNAAIYSEVGNLYVKSNNLKAAREELQKAVNLDPKNASYRTSLAGVLLDSDSADAAFSELTQVHPPAMANYQMAYMHFARKNIPATQQYLGVALQIDPNLKPARDLMASMGGARAIQNVAQQGDQWMNQAQSVMQQASAVSNSVQGLWQPPAVQGNNPATATALPVVSNAPNPIESNVGSMVR